MAYNLRRALVERQVIAPYLHNAFRSLDNWPTIAQLAIEHPGRHDSNQDDWFHPSIHSNECALGCYLTLHPIERKVLIPEEKSFTSVMTPMIGSIVHTIVQQKLLVDGLVEAKDIEVALQDDERHWRGHADLIFRDELVDIKTQRSENFKFKKEPLPYWKYQLNCYMDALGKDSCVVLVIEVGWPWATKEFRINKDQKILDEIYNKFAFVQDCIKADTPPSHEGCENKYCTVRQRLSESQKIALKE